MNKVIVRNSIISSIGFVSFEGVFWKLGANVFDKIGYSNLTLKSIGLTILAILCFAVFIYHIIISVKTED